MPKARSTDVRQQPPPRRDRRAERDPVKIFRRGVPFVELTVDGTLEGGLLFVSFQASMH